MGLAHRMYFADALRYVNNQLENVIEICGIKEPVIAWPVTTRDLQVFVNCH